MTRYVRGARMVDSEPGVPRSLRNAVTWHYDVLRNLGALRRLIERRRRDGFTYRRTWQLQYAVGSKYTVEFWRRRPPGGGSAAA